jgi:hypothetical protein
MSKTGKIKPSELRYYLKHWGLEPTDEVFQEIFDSLDLDHDGLISYMDMQTAVGKIVNPAEELYFRQDLHKMGVLLFCSFEGCTQPPAGSQNTCFMHLR